MGPIIGLLGFLSDYSMFLGLLDHYRPFWAVWTFIGLIGPFSDFKSHLRAVFGILKFIGLFGPNHWSLGISFRLFYVFRHFGPLSAI